jgi:hypothetical protein
MNFVYNIAVYNRTNDEIRLAVPRVMETWGYSIAPVEIAQQVEHSWKNLVPTIDPELMLRQVLISPNKNSWSVIYHTFHWFSEAQQFGLQLSKELEGIVLVFLQDDSYGWGYELSKRGEILDKFHTDPNSPTLHEKDGAFGFKTMIERNLIIPPPQTEIDVVDLARLMLPSRDEMVEMMAKARVKAKELILKRFEKSLGTLSPDQRAELESIMATDFDEVLAALPTPEERSQLIDKLPDPTLLDRLREVGAASPEQIAEYQGHPSILANLIGISEDRVAERLLKSRGERGIFAHDVMSDFLEEDLGIEDWWKSYSEFLDDLDKLEDWHHLILSKRMTDAELQWCKLEISQNFVPDTGPPIWINHS